LRKIVPLANTTIYEMEQRNEFPRRFYLTPRTPAWDLAEVEAWIQQRKLDSESGKLEPQRTAVHKRKWRPVRQA
jgi:prophage regulatory protein